MVIPGSQVRALVGAPRKRPCEGVVCVHTSCGRPSQMVRCVHPASTSGTYRVLCRWTRKPRGGAARRTIAGGFIESPEAANTSFGLRERPEKIWTQQNLAIIAPPIRQCRRTDQARSTAAWPEARSADRWQPPLRQGGARLREILRPNRLQAVNCYCSSPQRTKGTPVGPRG
jgi:hypothetical protein